MAKPKQAFSWIQGNFVVTEDSDRARELYAKSSFGKVSESKVYLSFFEALFLYDTGKLIVLDGRNKEMSRKSLVRRLSKSKDFLLKYSVFYDLRKKGYVVRTALKFGADFRVYDKGVKPGEDHARWIVFCVHESEKHTWKEFSAKMRVAHSTRKRLLIAAVDDESDVTYWETSWIRP